MERHLRSRRARGRLVAHGALLGLAVSLLTTNCSVVPLASFSRPASEPAPEAADASVPNGPTAQADGAAAEPDLPEPGDQPQAAARSLESTAVQEPQPAAAPAETSAAVVAAGPVVDDAATPVASEVRATLAEFYAAYNAREWKRARALFWSGATITDVRILPDNPAPAVKVASVAEFFEELARTREAGSMGFQGQLEGTPAVLTASNVAQAWCHFQASFGGPEETMSWRRVDAFTFVLHEGRWKITSLAQSNSFDTR